ncbi:MAG TPA: hypothetical protein VK826_09875 [Bacteroidia bacterium]|nr:hypothetical protein [Bacteroidia bacterium]
MKSICILLCAISLLMHSCTTSNPSAESDATINAGNKIIPDALRKNVQFTCSATIWGTVQKWTEVSATLYNNNSDTACFLTSTCDGDQYWLSYDTSKIQLSPMMQCNASYPRLVQIPPHGQYDFKAHFASKTQADSLTLGFYLHLTEKDKDLSALNVSDCSELIRRKHNLVWAAKIPVKQPE